MQHTDWLSGDTTERSPAAVLLRDTCSSLTSSKQDIKLHEFY